MNTIQSSSSPDSAATLRILVVDDNIDAAASLSMLLELAGHTTQQAYSGHDALTAARTFQPQVALLDLGLPGLNGYDVARALRSEVSAQRPLLVAVTGWSGDEDRVRAHAAGFDVHLVKPVDMAKLTEVLQLSPR